VLLAEVVPSVRNFGPNWNSSEAVGIFALRELYAVSVLPVQSFEQSLDWWECFEVSAVMRIAAGTLVLLQDV